ncbi:hypothetical protein CcaCcLH18_08178 [Colletotrichum camelliae]|nr:hypothetical protein CcaCcLH18_08178 [Colletotrichum camelliae]
MNFFSVQVTENEMASATVDVPTSLFPNLPPFDTETILAFHETSLFAEGGNNNLGEARLIYNAMNAISRETESTPKQSAPTPDITKRILDLGGKSFYEQLTSA